MIDYTIGDDIIAIRDHSQGKFKKGDVFTCKGILETFCKCKKYIIDIGIYSETNIQKCFECKQERKYKSDVWWFSSTSFKKLDFDISELTEILENVNQNTTP